MRDAKRITARDEHTLHCTKGKYCCPNDLATGAPPCISQGFQSVHTRTPAMPLRHGCYPKSRGNCVCCRAPAPGVAFVSLRPRMLYGRAQALTGDNGDDGSRFRGLRGRSRGPCRDRRSCPSSARPRDRPTRGDGGRFRSGHRGRPRRRGVMRHLIKRIFPSHGIVGEEFGDERRDAEYRLGARSDRRHRPSCRACRSGAR
jgi:hypothetical protein